MKGDNVNKWKVKNENKIRVQKITKQQIFPAINKERK